MNPIPHDDDDDLELTGGITKGALARFSRVDERTKAIQEDLRNFRNDIKNDIVNLLDRIKETEQRDNEKFRLLEQNHIDLQEHIEKNFVKKESFSPVQHLVYGFVGIVVTSVLAALISLVVVVKG